MKVLLEDLQLAFIKQKGTLDLTDRADITELPDGLIVPKNCILKGTSIKQTPNNFIVGGVLDCSSSAVQTIGKNTIVGNSMICGEDMENLPDDLILGGNLYLFFSNIKKLGKMKIGGYIKENPYFKENPDLFGKEKAKIHWLQKGEYIQDKGIQMFLGFIPTEKPIPLYQGAYYKGKIQKQNIFFDGMNYHLVRSLQNAHMQTYIVADYMSIISIMEFL